MPHRPYPPASLRYLKARLWNLARPGFWGTAIFLSVVGLIIKEYWTHPDFLTKQQKSPTVPQQPTDSNLSAEDRAIAADIDNLPVIFNDFKQDTLPATSTSSKINNPNQNKTSVAVNNQTESSIKNSNSAPVPPAPTIENPFLVQAENLLQFNGSSNNRTSAGTNSSGVTLDVPNFSQNITPVNALQTALDQSANQNTPNSEIRASSQVNSLAQSVPYNNSPVQGLSPYTGFIGGTRIPPVTPVYPQPGLVYSTPNYYSTGNTQPGLINQVPNSIYNTGTIQPGFTNQAPNSIYNTGYTQPNIISGTNNFVTGSVQQPGLAGLPANFTNFRDLSTEFRRQRRTRAVSGVQTVPNVIQPLPGQPVTSNPPFAPSPTSIVPNTSGSQFIPAQPNTFTSPSQLTGGQIYNRYP